MWSLSEEKGLRERFQSGVAILPGLYTRRRWGMTYQGFVKSLSRWSATLLSAVKNRLRERMQQLAGSHWRTHGWVVMAVDGTRVEVPRTRSNEAHFARVPSHCRRRRKSSKSKQKSRHHTSDSQTCLQHPGSQPLLEMSTCACD